MNLIYPNSGLLQWLNRMCTPSLHYHLFVDDITPDHVTSLGSLTEATFSGYAVVEVLEADFTIRSVTANVGSFVAPPISFTNSGTGAEIAYGYYVTDAANTILLAAARFDAAPVTKAAGGSWIVVPIVSDFSQF